METRSVEQAIRAKQRIGGLTHSLYRYPARFPPDFASAAIAEFTRPGEWVLDPFIGGGTSAVEALAAGRRIAGIDVNPLALLVARVKTTPLYPADERALEAWRETVGETIHAVDSRLVNAPYDYVKALAPLVAAVEVLPTDRQRDAARALLVHVGQWALDRREKPVPPERLRSELGVALRQHVAGLRSLADSSQRHGVRPGELARRRILRQGTAADVASGRPWNRLVGRFRLVLTSPPYPTVHVLYHRWQIRGRSETPFPFWLSGLNDGLGASHYTMGGRSLAGEATYFHTIIQSFTGIRRLLARDAKVVQLVSFHEPDRQLPLYLDAMKQAGFQAEETGISTREVPNRRWYYRVNPDRGGAHEYLLVHRLGA